MPDMSALSTTPIPELEIGYLLAPIRCGRRTPPFDRRLDESDTRSLEDVDTRGASTDQAAAFADFCSSLARLELAATEFRVTQLQATARSAVSQAFHVDAFSILDQDACQAKSVEAKTNSDFYDPPKLKWSKASSKIRKSAKKFAELNYADY
jgi:hypothetical protein